MMNLGSIMKLKNAKNKFMDNHPKFGAFLKSIFSKQMEEGTIIEITVSRPGETTPVTANIKVQQSDLELLAELQGLLKV